MSDLEDYVGRVAESIKATAPCFTQFVRTNATTHAIPFFGDVESAKALTVGVNPSAGEFINRGWPRTISKEIHTGRLQNYFTNEFVQPHPWFKTWTEALELLDLSYNGAVIVYVRRWSVFTH